LVTAALTRGQTASIGTAVGHTRARLSVRPLSNSSPSGRAAISSGENARYRDPSTASPTNSRYGEPTARISPSPGSSFDLSWAEAGTPQRPAVNIEMTCSLIFPGTRVPLSVAYAMYCAMRRTYRSHGLAARNPAWDSAPRTNSRCDRPVDNCRGTRARVNRRRSTPACDAERTLIHQISAPAGRSGANDPTRRASRGLARVLSLPVQRQPSDPPAQAVPMSSSH
jgi:hypothetical protein